jgi:hypothetical protein
MAPPSLVPGADWLIGYGPVIDSVIADLPASYLGAWTPPKELAHRPRPMVSIPPGTTGVATSYVHAKINGITGDLAVVKPGGRNTAIYTAALKVGSTLGAARSAPGAEQAAAEWTDQAAEDALTNQPAPSQPGIPDVTLAHRHERTDRQFAHAIMAQRHNVPSRAATEGHAD